MKYCKDCEWLYIYEDSMGECGYYCHHPSNLELKHDYYHEYISGKLLPSAFSMNMYNDCKNYKKLWWKFWIKN